VDQASRRGAVEGQRVVVAGQVGDRMRLLRKEHRTVQRRGRAADAGDRHTGLVDEDLAAVFIRVPLSW